MWELIDNLIVLTQGRTAYSGSRATCLQYFEQAGHEIPSFVNPFEFVMDITAIDSRSHQLESVSSARADALTRLWKRKSAQLYASEPQGILGQPACDATALLERSDHRVESRECLRDESCGTFTDCSRCSTSTSSSNTIERSYCYFHGQW